MKFTIQHGLSADSLRESVPPSYRARLPSGLTDEQFVLILFAHDRRDVVVSRVAQKALDEIVDDAGRIVAVGGNFTTEAAGILTARRAMILSLSEFHWTDDGYDSIRKRMRR